MPELEISLSEEQIARIVNSTFDEADLDRNGLIDMNEYHVSHPPCRYLCAHQQAGSG